METSTHAAVASAGPNDVQDDVSAREGAAAALAHDVGQQDSEMLNMLLIGFGTGMSIALVFLVYVLLEIAHLLP